MIYVPPPPPYSAVPEMTVTIFAQDCQLMSHAPPPPHTHTDTQTQTQTPFPRPGLRCT